MISGSRPETSDVLRCPPSGTLGTKPPGRQSLATVKPAVRDNIIDQLIGRKPEQRHFLQDQVVAVFGAYFGANTTVTV